MPDLGSESRLFRGDGTVKTLKTPADLLKHTGQKLDGKTPIKPVPFDAHEQATRGTHVPTKAGDTLPHAGQGAQYPKVVEHREGSEKGQQEAAVVVDSKEEEDKYLADKAKEKTEEKPA